LPVCLAGWKSEFNQPKASRRVPRMITLHEEARIFLFENFLSEGT
jgi:hypothetical protein